MESNIKRKAYRLDRRKVKRVKAILKTDTETAAIDAALDFVVLRKPNRLRVFDQATKRQREREAASGPGPAGADRGWTRDSA
ncbi:MAG TPA: hypothetical protein VGH16_23360 [Candidatus Binatia bacterium]|jgi:hypothetical protein